MESLGSPPQQPTTNYAYKECVMHMHFVPENKSCSQLSFVKLGVKEEEEDAADDDEFANK